MSTIVEPETFRSVLGNFPSGVTIVTGTTDDGPVGFTCQSFSALSVDPPLVLVLPGRSSTSWPQIETMGRFCVNVLSDSQRELSTVFAKSGGDKFVDVEWTPSPLGSPVLPDSCAWIDCEVFGIHPGGDHLVVVGAVHDLGAPHGTEPLVFHRGNYGSMGTSDR